MGVNTSALSLSAVAADDGWDVFDAEVRRVYQIDHHGKLLAMGDLEDAPSTNRVRILTTDETRVYLTSTPVGSAGGETAQVYAVDSSLHFQWLADIAPPRGGGFSWAIQTASVGGNSFLAYPGFSEGASASSATVRLAPFPVNGEATAATDTGVTAYAGVLATSGRERLVIGGLVEEMVAYDPVTMASDQLGGWSTAFGRSESRSGWTLTGASPGGPDRSEVLALSVDESLRAETEPATVWWCESDAGACPVPDTISEKGVASPSDRYLAWSDLSSEVGGALSNVYVARLDEEAHPVGCINRLQVSLRVLLGVDVRARRQIGGPAGAPRGLESIRWYGKMMHLPMWIEQAPT